MKKITAALIGAGQRGMDSYAPYGLDHPEEIQFVAVSEVLPERRERFRRLHNVPEHLCFQDWKQLLDGPKLADAVLICTQDRMHFEPAMRALEKGYHVLLEKPMSPDPLECLILGEAASKSNLVFTVCHSMRYIEFFIVLKNLLDEGTIGRLVTATHIENVEHRHQAHSFVRGNWRDSTTTSPMILAKCCHDLDMLMWLIGSDCRKVSSFGSLTHFRQENAPAGAPLRCLDGCPVQDECAYYAPRAYLGREDRGGLLFRSVVSADPSEEAVMEALRTGPYGRCVYHCDNNVVDHQVVNLEFENDVTVAFTMTAFTAEGGRHMKLMGTTGQIRGNTEKNEIEVTSFITGRTDTIRLAAAKGGHDGGDMAMMRDFIGLIQRGGESKSRSGADVSAQSHLIAFAAEKARVESSVVVMKEYMAELKTGIE